MEKQGPVNKKVTKKVKANARGAGAHIGFGARDSSRHAVDNEADFRNEFPACHFMRRPSARRGRAV
jgi:hypothetical protein